MNLGLHMNFGPSPRSDFAFAGAVLFGVKSWKAMFVGIVEIVDTFNSEIGH